MPFDNIHFDTPYLPTVSDGWLDYAIPFAYYNLSRVALHQNTIFMDNYTGVHYFCEYAEGIRTPDPLLAKPILSNCMSHIQWPLISTLLESLVFSSVSSSHRKGGTLPNDGSCTPKVQMGPKGYLSVT